MPHKIIFNPELHTIESIVQGDLTFSEAKEIIAEFELMAKENNCMLFLNDYREATVKMSITDIYELPKIMIDTFAKSGINARLLKRALIVKNDLEDYLFYETVTTNTGQNAKIFYDIVEAKKWLLGK